MGSIPPHLFFLFSVRSVQLLRRTGLQSHGKVFQRISSSRSLGLFWRVQQDWTGGKSRDLAVSCQLFLQLRHLLACNPTKTGKLRRVQLIQHSKTRPLACRNGVCCRILTHLESSWKYFDLQLCKKIAVLKVLQWSIWCLDVLKTFNIHS